MDLRFTPEELAFREEVRAFFRESLPEEIRRKMADGEMVGKDDMVTWTRILNAKGWSVPHWPVEHGGTGWDPMQQYIFLEELQKTPPPRRCPSASTWSGR
jgi:Acyl-CoA dehydrogenases